MFADGPLPHTIWGRPPHPPLWCGGGWKSLSLWPHINADVGSRATRNKERGPNSNALRLWVQVADSREARRSASSCGLCAAHYSRSLETSSRIEAPRLNGCKDADDAEGGFIFRCMRSCPRSPTHLLSAYVPFSKWPQMPSKSAPKYFSILWVYFFCSSKLF